MTSEQNKEVLEFWQDICQMSEDKPYYMGVITTESIDIKSENTSRSWREDEWIIKTSNYRPYHIVDGQQRLTSLILLLNSIIQHCQANKKEELNFLLVNSIYQKFIAVQKGTLTETVTTLFGYDSGSSSSDFFLGTILKVPISDYDRVKMTKYNQNLKNAMTFFSKKIQTLNDDELETLFRKITSNVRFNWYQINDDIDVYVTFETMNNRGKILSTLELLKNRLIYLTTLLPPDVQTVSSQIRQAVNDCWKKIYDYLGKNPDQMLRDDSFLRVHTSVYFRSKDQTASVESELYRDFYEQDKRFMVDIRKFLLSKMFTAENITSGRLSADDLLRYIKSLNKNITIWYYINFPEELDYNIDFTDDQRIYLIKIRQLADPYTFLEEDNWQTISLYYISNVLDNNARTSFLQQYERYLFVQHFDNLVAYRYWEKEQIAPFSMKSLFETESLESYPNKINQLVTKWINSEVFRNVLTDISKQLSLHGFYKNATINTKYILIEYLIDCNAKAKQPLQLSQIASLYDSTTIEHVFPQKVKGTNWNRGFEEYTESEKVKIKNSIGNLLAMSKEKNEKIGNKSFREKISHGRVGYSFGYVDEQNIAKNEQWTFDEIKNRGYDIVNFINQRWYLKITKSERNAFIGLQRIIDRTKK